MRDKRKDPNLVLIIADIGDRKRKTKKEIRRDDSAKPLDNDDMRGAFEVLPANTTSVSDEQKRPTKGGKKKRKHKKEGVQEDDDDENDVDVSSLTNEKKSDSNIGALTSDNYQERYMREQLKELEEKHTVVSAPDPGRRDAETRAAVQKQAINDMRFRAQDLQNQISWWRQQIGLGQYTDAAINGTIAQLERQLGTIPSELWA